ncbi:hypothetical protein [Hydrogenophaga sp.]|uniref:hypothetical protein n=1 Tax=Hydrogenophaga sp. TaxID=1904254 RepID=UPI003F6D3536
MFNLVPCAAPWKLFVLAVVLCCAALPTWAAGNTTAKESPRKPAKVSFVDAPSSEKPAARKQRLKRECKGRPNAGMCLGHTR